MKPPSPAAARALSAGEWALAGLLAGNLAWTSLHLGGVRAETMAASWLLTGAALALHLLLAAFSGERRRWGGAGVLLAVFLVYAAANVRFVTPVRWLGVRDWLAWVQMIAVFWTAWRGLRRAGPRGLLLGVAVMLGLAAAVLCAYQWFSQPGWLMMGRAQTAQYFGRASGFMGNPNSMAAFFALLIPPVLALAWQRGAGAGRRLACGYAAAAMLFGWVLTLSRGGWLALAAAFAVWPLFARGRTRGGRLRRCGAVLAAFAVAGGGLYVASPAARARADKFAADHGEQSRPILWKAALRLAAGAPVFGTGAGSFNVLFERERPEGFRDEPQWAHNDFLNTLGDYGAAGFLLFFGAAGAVTWRLLRARREADGREYLFSGYDDWCAPEITRAIGVGLLALGLACLVDFHLKIPSVAMLAAILAAEGWRRVESSGARDAPDKKPGSARLNYARRAACALAAPVVVWSVAGAVMPLFYEEAARRDGRALIDSLAKPGVSEAEQRSVLSRAEGLLVEGGYNPQACADIAYANALWSRVEPGNAQLHGCAAELAARAALARSDVVYEFWIRLGVALDVQGRWVEAGDAFSRALGLAPASAFAWYHQAYHLGLNPAAQSLAGAAVETCLRLDPGYEPAKVLRLRLRASH